MPVGNQNDGIALLTGQVMVSGSFLGQHISWFHDPVESEPNWRHAGTFTSNLIEPSLSIGITNDLNLSLSQILGVRSMTFYPEYVGGGEEPDDFSSTHHRDEDSGSGFRNANGGLLGDMTVMLKYVLSYATFGAGGRSFINAGLSIPSNNYLTSDPYFRETIDADGDGIITSEETQHFLDSTSFEDQSHKHFAMSDGLYRFIFQPSFYYKREKNPVFFGVMLGYRKPIHALTKDLGFRGGDIFEAHLTSLLIPAGNLKEFLPMGTSLSLGLSITGTSESGWDGYITQNSKELVVIPALGIIYNTKKIGTFNVSLRKPYFIAGIRENADQLNSYDSDFDQGADELDISLSYRLPMKFYLW